MKTVDEYRKAFVFGTCTEHGLCGALGIKGPSLGCGSCLEAAFAECQRDAISAAGKCPDDLIASMPEGTIFPVSRGLLKRVAASIRALLPPVPTTKEPE